MASLVMSTVMEEWIECYEKKLSQLNGVFSSLSLGQTQWLYLVLREYIIHVKIMLIGTAYKCALWMIGRH